MNFREHHRWHLVSEDAYYAIDPHAGGGFEAFHIEALWAKPASIGRAPTSELAAQLCEEHSQRPRAA
jgi:hypothetical protein